MHTGALYLTPQDQPGLPACKRLHTYGLAVFLAMFSLTLLGILVSHVTWRQEVVLQCSLSQLSSYVSPFRSSWSIPVVSTDGW